MHPCFVDASPRRAGHCRSAHTVRRKFVDALRRSDRDLGAFPFPPEYSLDPQVFPTWPDPHTRGDLSEIRWTRVDILGRRRRPEDRAGEGKKTVADGIRPTKNGGTGRWKTWIAGLGLAWSCTWHQERSSESCGATQKNSTHGNGGEVYGFKPGT